MVLWCRRAERNYPRPKVRVEAERRYHMPQVRGGGRGEQPRSKEQQLHRRRRASCEEIPLVQGKEQRLPFAGATMKRYPTPKVRETQVRW